MRPREGSSERSEVNWSMNYVNESPFYFTIEHQKACIQLLLVITKFHPYRADPHETASFCPENKMLAECIREYHKYVKSVCFKLYLHVWNKGGRTVGIWQQNFVIYKIWYF